MWCLQAITLCFPSHTQRHLPLNTLPHHLFANTIQINQWHFTTPHPMNHTHSCGPPFLLHYYPWCKYIVFNHVHDIHWLTCSQAIELLPPNGSHQWKKQEMTLWHTQSGLWIGLHLQTPYHRIEISTFNTTHEGHNIVIVFQSFWQLSHCIGATEVLII